MGRPGGQPLDWTTELTRKLQQKGYVAIGWPFMGDLSKLPADRAAFKEHFLETCGWSPSSLSLGQQVGILYRFVHVVGAGELIVSPTPGGGPVRIGKVIGDYEYVNSDGDDYHHRRKVDWIVSRSRDELSDDQRRALTVQMSLFQIYIGADDFRRMAK
jgi:predicted Mrr-cat superfamily restriction endonuclease